MTGVFTPNSQTMRDLLTDAMKPMKMLFAFESEALHVLVEEYIQLFFMRY